MTWRILLALLITGSAAAPANADQDRPPATPTRDVDVTYKAGEGDQAVVERSRWSAATQKLRVDTPTPGVYAIADYAARTLSMVSEPARGVMDLDAGEAAFPGAATSAGVGFIRRGGSEVAGVPCTEWETSDRQGHPMVACYTEDGVLLKARQGAQVFVQATRVAYGRVDPSIFVVPPSYRHASPTSVR